MLRLARQFLVRERVLGCTTILGITIWGFTFGLTQGCVEPSAFPQKLDPPALPAVVSESWFPLLDRSDVDPADSLGGTIYLFRDGDLKRWASEDVAILRRRSTPPTNRTSRFSSRGSRTATSSTIR
jgi:hypothetical protein